MKKLITLGAMLVALATAGPALADHGQSSDHSVLTVQVGSGNVSPAVSANAPANVDAPVCVAGICTSQAGTQENDGAASGTNAGSSSGSSEPSGQSADESIGTVQFGSVTVDPAAAVAAPVNANAPVCVLAACSSTNGGQQTGPTTATTTDAGQSQSGQQSSHESIGTVQVGSVDVSPAAAVAAPVNANAPVCVLAACSSPNSGQQTGPVSATTNDAGQSQPVDQSTDESVGTVQIGSVVVDTAVAASAPLDANAPVCVLSACRSTAGDQGGGDTPGGGDNPGGDNPGGPTGNEPGTPPTTSQTGTAPQPGPTGPTGPVNTAGENAAEPAPSEAEAGTESTAAGQGVRGAESGSTGGRTLQAVAAKGELPFTGLPLPAALVIGAALLLFGAGARKATGSARRWDR